MFLTIVRRRRMPAVPATTCRHAFVTALFGSRGTRRRSAVWLGPQDVVAHHGATARHGGRGSFESARHVADDVQIVKVT